MPNAPGMTLSLHVRESKTLLDSGLALDSGLLKLHSGFQSPAIQIPHSKISRIPKCRFPHMGSVLGPLRSLRTSLRQSNPKMYTLIWQPDLPRISFFRTATQHNVKLCKKQWRISESLDSVNLKQCNTRTPEQPTKEVIKVFVLYYMCGVADILLCFMGTICIA